MALRYRGVPEAEPNEFVGLLRRLGERHEKAHLATLAGVVDLSGLEDAQARVRETLTAIRAGAPAIYQARFRAEVSLDGEPHDLVGEPDFLVRAPARDDYLIRDSKLARHIDDGNHPEIVLQLQLYGRLYKRVVGTPPAGLEVHCGTGGLVPVPYGGSEAALGFLRELRRMRLAPEDAYEPVGWSKCGDCGYRDLCWKQAEAAQDVALLPGVDQGWARKLREHGVPDIPALRAAFDRPDLRDLFYERATRKKPERIKPAALTISRSLEAHESKAAVPIGPVKLPDPATCVMLDFEGLPPHLDDLEKIYLWGIKDFRSDPPRYLHAAAGFGEEGDRHGWEDFLRIAAGVLDATPGLRFVHYGNYEKTKINLYLGRFGDPTGTADRVRPESGSAGSPTATAQSGRSSAASSRWGVRSPASTAWA